MTGSPMNGSPMNGSPGGDDESPVQLTCCGIDAVGLHQ
jgi:hypothetical protein